MKCACCLRKIGESFYLMGTGLVCESCRTALLILMAKTEVEK